MAQFELIFTPLEPIVTIVTIGSQLSQEHDVDTGEFVPNRIIVPTVIQPNVVITDPDGLIANGNKNSQLVSSSVKWYVGEIKAANEILASNADYLIDRSATETRGRITVKKNVPSNSPLTLVFTATFTDIYNGNVRRKIDVIESATLTSSVRAGIKNEVTVQAIGGSIYNPLVPMSFIKLQAQLKRGSTDLTGHYWWYKKVGSNETILDSAYTGYNTNSIKIPTHEIGQSQLYVVKSQAPPLEVDPAKQTYIDSHTPNLGKNLLKDAKFRKGRTPNEGASWSVGNSARVTLADGKALLQSGGASINIGQRITGLTIGIEYNLTIRVKTTGITGPEGAHGVVFSISNSNYDPYSTVIIGSTEWTVYTLPFTVSDTLSDVVIELGGATAGTAEIEEPMVSVGATFDTFAFNNSNDLNTEADILYPAGEGNRPSTPGVNAVSKTIALGTKYPNYTWKLVTEYGVGDNIKIPASATSVQVLIQFDTVNGTVVNPENYWSVNWGGGKTGITQTFTKAEILALNGIINPVITEIY